MLESIRTYLAARGLGTAGTDLFTHHMPETVKQGILLLYPLVGPQIEPYLGYRRMTFHAIVRHTDYDSGFALANQVRDALTIGETELEGVTVRYVQPLNDPVPYPVSKGDFLEFRVSFETVYVIKQ